MGAADRPVEDLGRRRGGVDHFHVLAVGHDRADLDLLEVENAVQHVALVLDHRALLRVQRDRPAELLLRGVRRLRPPGSAERPQGGGDDQAHGGDHGREKPYDWAQQRRDAERRAIGVADRVGFGQDLGEIRITTVMPTVA